MVNIRRAKIERVFKLALNIDCEPGSIWVNRLASTLVHLSEDLKQWPQLRGGLIASFICGDVAAIEKAYRDITLPQNHHLSLLNGVTINLGKGISFKRHDYMGKQLEMIFKPVMYNLRSF